ncbi:MAG: hypothetical protein DRJ47_04020 [Thermoprotei archaeon]|nr:MAG: hypothetical protein DRJ47_04020 [Thermoprotei archaeon]
MKKSIINVFLILILVLTPYSYTLVGRVKAQEKEEYYIVSVVVQASKESLVPENHPIIVRLRDIAAALPKNVDPFGGKTTTEEDDVDWKAVTVLYKGRVIPSQIDDLDLNGFSPEDELAFLTVSQIPAGESSEYQIFIPLKASNLPEVAFETKVKINEYRLLEEIKKGSPEFMSEAYEISNGLIVGVVAVKAAWMSGGIFSILINSSGYDVVKQGSEYMSLLWKWSRLFCPADPGWIEHNPNAATGGGKVVYMKEGPVRGIISVVLESQYHNITDLYPVFTYYLYANHTWIYTMLDITGSNAKPGMFLEVNLANREWGGIGCGGKYSLVIINGAGNFSRTDDVNVPVSEIKEGWYVSLDPNNGTGFGFIFPTTGLDSVKWSFDDEGIHTYYTAMTFPYKSIIVVFDKTVTSNPLEYVKTIYNEYYIHAPNVIVKPAVKITQLPAALSQMKEIFELQKQIAELEKMISNLSKEITRLTSVKSVLEIVVYRTRILLLVAAIILFLIGYVAGRGYVYRRKRR